MKWLVWFLWTFYVCISAPGIIGHYTGTEFALGCILMAGLVAVPWLFIVGNDFERF